MKLAKILLPSGKDSIGLVEGGDIVPLSLAGGQFCTLSDVLEAEDPNATVNLLLESSAKKLPLTKVTLLAPIDRQEVWAAGVTYTRSRTARMEESETSASVYDKVYGAARPELFFKASPSRVAGPGNPLRIRRDSQWNVPEPELALVLNSRLELVGFTVGNDMSSRDIEGENPLYLPQAKVYDQCCGLGPWITLGTGMPPRDRTKIRMAVVRQGETVFQGATRLDRLARSYESLIEYLGRDNTFRDGVILLTGTGIVPEKDFTLLAGDTVNISIDGIGTLSNPVVQGD